MKEWKKPLVKVVVLEDELLTDTICSSGQHEGSEENPGIGLDRGKTQDISNDIWK